MQIAPLGKQIVVRLLPAAPASTILATPDPAFQPAQWAQIVSVGPSVPDLHVDNQVLISTNQGIAVNDCLLLPYTAVLCVRDSEI